MNNNPQNEQATARCSVCFEVINANAKKCIHCGSYQGMRQYVNFSSSFLALVVALISVLSFFIPLMKETFETKDSDIGVSLQFVQKDGIYLIAKNSGVRAGNIGLSKFIIEGVNNNEGFQLTVANRTTGKSFVPANESTMVTLYRDEREKNTIDSLTEDIFSKKCSIKIEIINFSEERQYPLISKQCDYFREFILKQLADTGT